MKSIKNAAFIKVDEFSHVNSNLLNQLRLHFPECNIEVVDLFRDIVSKKTAAFYGLLEYWNDILLFRKSLGSSFINTEYIFRKVKDHLKILSEKQVFDFTIQTQSMFDASIPGIPHFVYTDHTHKENLRYPSYDRRRFFGEKWIRMEEKIYRNASMVFTMSSNISRSVIEDYSCNSEKVNCVYCGSNIGADPDDIIDESKYSGKNILFIGIEWERKGGPVLVDAFRKVLKVYPDATLTIVGTDANPEIPDCRVVGKVSIEEVKKYFNQAAVFCMPTNIEPFGIVFIEAMSMKLPVIGTSIGAIPDFIKNGVNGYMVEPGNSEKLADHLIELLGDPSKCKNFGEEGHRLFLEKYSWDKTGQKISNCIRQVLNQEPV